MGQKGNPLGATGGGRVYYSFYQTWFFRYPVFLDPQPTGILLTIGFFKIRFFDPQPFVGLGESKTDEGFSSRNLFESWIYLSMVSFGIQKIHVFEVKVILGIFSL